MELKTVIDELAVHTGLMNELLQVFERETAEMGEVNIAAMNASNQAKEELIARISAHTPHLKRAISELAAREGLPATASLGTLAEHISKKGNKQLLAKQQEIRLAAERVQQVAALNREIAENFSASVTTSLGLITRLINQSNVYGASGGYQQRTTGAVMINREA